MDKRTVQKSVQHCSAGRTGADVAPNPAALRTSHLALSLPQRALIGVLVLAVSAAGLQAQQKVEFSDAAVEKAIDNARKYFWARYREADGNWGEDMKPEDPRYGGYSALAIYALLASGESYQSEKMKKALEWQTKAPVQGTYVLGIRCQIWAMLPRESAYRQNLKRDVNLLLNGLNKVDNPSKMTATTGIWSYDCEKPGDGVHGDHSNTQYGYLGLWAGTRANLEEASEKWIWEQAFKHYIMTQNADGGWSYSPGTASPMTTSTMTVAGLASLFVAFDQISGEQFVKVGQNPEIPAIKHGLEWLDKNYADAEKTASSWYYYFLYGVERVGLASGYKYFGQQDWYKMGATKALAAQAKDGSWSGGIVNTAFVTVFLVRGRNPVLFNRLEYTGDWNNRPRSLANLCAWFSKTFEKEVNWQIINTKVPVEEWHDAPILVLTGDKKAEFTDEELTKLRTFAQQGGMLLSIVEGQTAGTSFDSSMRNIYKKLFPQYELTQLPPNHPLYSLYFKMTGHGSLWGLSNGSRFLAIHCTEDLPLFWQKNQTSTESDAFRIATNIYFYATDRASLLRARGTSLWPEAKAFEPAATIDLARLSYNGNWNPEPLALERFKLVMGDERKVKINIQDKAIAKLGDADRIAVLTGTGHVSFSDDEKAALKKFIQAGGTLIIDSAGGNDKFADSVSKQLQEMYGQECLVELPADSPVYALEGEGLAITSFKYRKVAEAALGVKKKAPHVLAVSVGGRPAVFFSREDLTTGLVGCPVGLVGYEPHTATAIMRNLVLFAAKNAPPPAGSQPVK